LTILSTDVVIIGGGVIGLATAHELLQRGAAVTVLERASCGREASWAGGGILSPLMPWDYTDTVTQLTQASVKLFPALIESLKLKTGIDPEYQTSGLLVLPSNSGERDAAADAWCTRNAFPMKKIPAREIAPELACDELAMWLPAVAQVRNPRLLQALAKAVKLSGGVIIEQAEVASWRVVQGRVEGVATGQGEYTAANFIVAAGAWSHPLLGEHALKLDIHPVRGQMLLFKARPGLLHTIILQDGFYLIPRQDGYILAGSTLEKVGFDKSTTAEVRQALLVKAHALLPALSEATLLNHWAGLRPGSTANIPVISRHPAIANLYLNSGHHRYGVTMAPGSAQLMANMLLDAPQPFDVTPYSWPN